MNTPIIRAHPPVVVRRNRFIALATAGFLALAQPWSACGATVTQTANDNLNETSFNTGLHWSDATAPSSGNVYVNNQYLLRTPVVASNVTFAGASLTIGNNVNAPLFAYKGSGSRTVTVNNLILNKGTVHAGGASGMTFTLAGNVNVLAGGGIFDQANAGASISVTAPIQGAGALSIMNSGATAATTSGTTLTTANTYGGGTAVKNKALLVASADGALGTGWVNVEPGGLLKLQSGTTKNYIGNDAVLNLGPALAASSVSLAYSGTDTVRTLTIDGGRLQAKAGTWGASGSGATNTNPVFTGTGLLNVVTGPASSNPFGVFTINRGLWSSKMPDAAWDRGIVRMNTIVKNVDGSFSWASSPTSQGIDSNFYGANCYALLPTDRNWVMCLDGLPSWLQSNATDILTPNNWTDFENMVKWVVDQFPSQVKVVEPSNEYGWWGTTSRAWPNVTSMAEYIKRVSRAVRVERPELTVAGPVWVTTASYLRDRFVELAAVSWSDGTRTLDWLDAISMHNYSGLDEVGAEAKFTGWTTDLSAWFTMVATLGYGHKAHYWTEFGFPLKYNDSSGNPTGRAVTESEAARFYARAMTILKAEGASCIMPFSLASFNGHGGTQDFGFYDTTNTVKRQAYYAAETTMVSLKNTGDGTVTTTGTRTVVDFGDRAVIWDRASSYSYNTGYTILSAVDLDGDPVTVTGGNTVMIGADPVFLEK